MSNPFENYPTSKQYNIKLDRKIFSDIFNSTATLLNEVKECEPTHSSMENDQLVNPIVQNQNDSDKGDQWQSLNQPKNDQHCDPVAIEPQLELLQSETLEKHLPSDEINDCPKSVHHETPESGTSSLCPTTSTTTTTTPCKKIKRSVLFDTVTVYHFTRSQGFNSVPTQGGSTLGMKQKHFLRRKLSVDMFEEVRRRSRREILLKIKLDKERRKGECDILLPCSSNSSSSPSSSDTRVSDSDDGSISDCSDISDSELESESYIFVQPLGVKVRRSLLRASGVNRIDPREKKECKKIRDSRLRTGCSCVNQCIPGLCECTLLGVNCHVDRISFPCGCHSEGCRNPQGRTEFDTRMVKNHLVDTLFKEGIG